MSTRPPQSCSEGSTGLTTSQAGTVRCQRVFETQHQMEVFVASADALPDLCLLPVYWLWLEILFPERKTHYETVAAFVL